MEMGATEGFKMYKLIQLLTEYNNNKEGARIGLITTIDIDGVSTPYELGKSDLLRWEDKIISKSYGFIKWLVENDKIDRNKLEIRPFSDGLVYSDSDCTVYRTDTTYEMLLMLLSISDTPIEDLISYLK